MSEVAIEDLQPAPDHGRKRSSMDKLTRILDELAERFAEAVVEQLQRGLSRRRGASRARPDRLCPFPGCKEFGAGPRNRWFCKEHARSVPVREQVRLLEERRRTASESRRIARAKRPGSHLDMRCRVESCKNISRGPRFGYICDEHRRELSAKEQQAARDRWNERKANRS